MMQYFIFYIGIFMCNNTCISVIRLLVNTEFVLLVLILKCVFLWLHIEINRQRPDYAYIVHCKKGKYILILKKGFRKQISSFASEKLSYIFKNLSNSLISEI